MTSQVIAKRDPLDRLGNVVEVDGRLMVIEYSDLPDDVARRRNADGSLAIWAGSIAVHVFDLAFLERMAAAAEWSALPRRLQEGGLPGRRGPADRAATAQRAQVRAVHLRSDALADRAIVVEVDPARAFAPLKNASGAKDDTPETVRARMAALASRVAARRGRWKWPTAWRSRSARYGRWTPRSLRPRSSRGRGSRSRRICGNVLAGVIHFKSPWIDAKRDRGAPWGDCRFLASRTFALQLFQGASWGGWLLGGRGGLIVVMALMVMTVFVVVAVLMVAVLMVAVFVEGLALGALGFLLLDDLVAGEVDLAVDLVRDDVVPVGEAGVELLDPLLAVGDLLVVLLLFALVLFLDALALGLEVGLLLDFLRFVLLAGLLLRGGGLADFRSSPGFCPEADGAGSPAGFFVVFSPGRGSSSGLAMASGLNSAMTNR